MFALLSPRGKRNRRGAIFFNWGLVFIAFFTLSAAFIALVVKEHQMSETNPTIGEKQFALYHCYQDGEMMMESLDLAAERSAERSAHLLALQGGYLSDALAASECGVSGNGTAIWIDVDKECFPPDYFTGYMTLFDQGLADYFGSDAFTYDKPRYAHFFGEGVLEGGGDVEIISRALDHVAINLTDPTDVFLTEGFFNPLEEEVFTDSITELSYSGIPTESYFINVTDPTAKLAEIGEWVPTVNGTYSGLCHYCNKNKQLLRDYYPGEYEDCDPTVFGQPFCCEGKCPPGSLVLNVLYHAQCSYGSRPSNACTEAYPMGHNICGSGCGPTSTMMAVEAAAGQVQDIYSTWDALGTSCGGSGGDQINSYLRRLGLYYETSDPHHYDLSLEDIGTHISEGRPIIMNPLQRYNDERSCYNDACGGTVCGHFFLVVGIAPDGNIIIHDPYPGPGARAEGGNLVLRKETLQRLYNTESDYPGYDCYNGERVWYAVVQPKVDLKPAVEEAESPEDEGPEVRNLPEGME